MPPTTASREASYSLTDSSAALKKLEADVEGPANVLDGVGENMNELIALGKACGIRSGGKALAFIVELTAEGVDDDDGVVWESFHEKFR